MLVLTRGVGEKIHIGENITLTVTNIKGTRIKVAIDAPKSVVVLRGELAEKGKVA